MQKSFFFFGNTQPLLSFVGLIANQSSDNTACFHLCLTMAFAAVYTLLQQHRPASFGPVAVEINALLRGNKWRIWGEPFVIEMQSERQTRRRFSHINMCLSGPSPPSGGGPQHQMELSLAYVSPTNTCHKAALHFPLSSMVIYPSIHRFEFLLFYQLRFICRAVTREILTNN